MKRVKILSTRLLDASIAKRLRQKAFELEEHAFIRTQPVATQETIARINRLTTDEVVAFTSAVAVEIVKDMFPQVPLKVYCISGQTRQAIERHFPTAMIAGTAESGKGLAEQIIEAGISKLVFISGSQRRDELPVMLVAANIGLEELQVYETLETPVAISGNFDAVLFFSPSAVRSFFSMNQLQADSVCFAIGATTAGAIREYCGNKIITPSFPSQEAMATEIENQFDAAL